MIGRRARCLRLENVRRSSIPTIRPFSGVESFGQSKRNGPALQYLVGFDGGDCARLAGRRWSRITLCDCCHRGMQPPAQNILMLRWVSSRLGIEGNETAHEWAESVEGSVAKDYIHKASFAPVTRRSSVHGGRKVDCGPRRSPTPLQTAERHIMYFPLSCVFVLFPFLWRSWGKRIRKPC